jgi:hypothetical protein
LDERRAFPQAVLGVMLAAAAAAAAVPSSDTLLSQATKGYVSIARPTEMRERWNRTQFGHMLADEVMQPFVDDLRQQLDDKYDVIKEKLGITWTDLDGVPAGELSLSILERKEKTAALVLTIDVTDHKTQADRLMAAVARRFADRGARKEVVESNGTSLTLFTIRAAGANAAPQETVYFIKDNVLCGVDDRGEAEAMLVRFAGTSKDNLRSVAAYTASMERCRRDAKGLEPELRWYADPFGFIFASRTLRKTPRNPHDKDVAKILSEQGFDAIKGVGGYINLLAEGGVEILHRTAIHAPPLPGKEKDPLRWSLSMRMLQLPNGSTQEPPSWAPRMSATYSTVNVDMLAAFDNVGPLIDGLRGHQDAWKNTLHGWKTDPYGAQIDLREEIIAHLGKRVALLTDYTTPITVDSERSLLAVEVRDEAKVAAGLAKWMKKEPDRKQWNLKDVIIWERVPPEAQADIFEIESPVFGGAGKRGGDKAKEEKQRERVLPNSAVCVALGHLMMASDVEYLKEILAGFGQRDRLASADDFQQVVATMAHVSPGEHSGWSFARMDEEVRPTYELLRQGKMPQSDTMLGKLLNDLLRTDAEKQEGVLRKQQIDGSTLPSFEAVRRYFGPAGRVLRSDPDGWLFSGAVLNKEAP